MVVKAENQQLKPDRTFSEFPFGKHIASGFASGLWQVWIIGPLMAGPAVGARLHGGQRWGQLAWGLRGSGLWGKHRNERRPLFAVGALGGNLFRLRELARKISGRRKGLFNLVSSQVDVRIGAAKG